MEARYIVMACEEIFYAAAIDKVDGKDFLIVLISQGPAAAADALGEKFDKKLQAAIDAALAEGK